VTGLTARLQDRTKIRYMERPPISEGLGVARSEPPTSTGETPASFLYRNEDSLLGF
jgi:hypothetical protein